jgi:hypothetical protein
MPNNLQPLLKNHRSHLLTPLIGNEWQLLNFSRRCAKSSCAWDHTSSLTRVARVFIIRTNIGCSRRADNCWVASPKEIRANRDSASVRDIASKKRQNLRHLAKIGLVFTAEVRSREAWPVSLKDNKVWGWAVVEGCVSRIVPNLVLNRCCHFSSFSFCVRSYFFQIFSNRFSLFLTASLRQWVSSVFTIFAYFHLCVPHVARKSGEI